MKKILLFSALLLACSGIAGAQTQPGLAVGDQAPDFEAPNHLGEMVRLSDKYQNSPVILLFYRGGWCPYCNTQLQEYQSQIDVIKALGANVVAVSVDKIEKASDTVLERQLDFEVISNPSGDILKAYGLVYVVSDDLNKKYKEEYSIDLESSSGQAHHMIAIPATYIIGEDGVILFANANEDYKVRPPVQEIINALAQLKTEKTNQ